MLQQQQIDMLRNDLLRERQELVQRLQHNDKLGMNGPMRDTIGELSLIDNHPADVGSELFERGKDLSLTELLEHQLSQIDAALERMDQGLYGRCRECGEPISFERLQAMPYANDCIQHAPKQQATHRRPIEEEVLDPAMRSSVDEKDTTTFDGEDAWQIVESWGTSNTPALQEGRNMDDYDEMYMEADENEGYVEAIESFLATDLYGNNVTFYRNGEYRNYMQYSDGGIMDSGEYDIDDPYNTEQAEAEGYF